MSVYTCINMRICVYDRKLRNFIECLVEFLIFLHKKVASPQLFDFSSRACIRTPCDFFAVTLIQSESNTGSNMAKTWEPENEKDASQQFFFYFFLLSRFHKEVRISFSNTPTKWKLCSHRVASNYKKPSEKLVERLHWDLNEKQKVFQLKVNECFPPSLIQPQLCVFSFSFSFALLLLIFLTFLFIHLVFLGLRNFQVVH